MAINFLTIIIYLFYSMQIMCQLKLTGGVHDIRIIFNFVLYVVKIAVYA